MTDTDVKSLKHRVLERHFYFTLLYCEMSDTYPNVYDEEKRPRCPPEIFRKLNIFSHFLNNHHEMNHGYSWAETNEISSRVCLGTNFVEKL